MNAYALLPLCSFLVNLFLLAYVWGAMGRWWGGTARAYVGLLASCCVWTLADAICWGLVTQEASAVIWLRASAPGWILAPVLVLNVVYEVTNRKRDRVFRGLAWCAALASVLAVSTDWVVAGAQRFEWGFLGGSGWLFPPVLALCLLIPSTLSIVWAVRAVRVSSGVQHKQLRLFAAGITISLAGALLVNVVLISLFKVDTIPLGSTIAGLQSLFVTAAVLRYRFLSVGLHHVTFGLFSRASDGVVILDGERRIADLNPSATELLGPSHAKGMRPEPLFPPPYVAGQRHHGLKIRLPHPQGVRAVLLSEHELVESGLVVGHLILLRDITELEAAEKEHAALETEVREQQERKMVALGQLAGGIAHDFNNMLTAIVGYVELLGDGQANDPEHAENVSAIREVVTRASGLTRQMLAFARRSPLDMAIFDAHESVRRTSDLLRHSLGKHIQVVLDLKARNTSVLGDCGQWESALLNLGVNARDAMPGGGTLTFSTEDCTLGPDTGHRGQDLPVGRVLRIRVADTGVGMSPATLQHLFEPFFTTKEMGRGTGLGLASVHGVMKQHRGHISVESTLGQGTVFTILLPVANQASSPKAKPDLAVPPPPPAGTTVLLVDDEPAIRTTMSALLRRQGYQVLTAVDGQDALRVFATRPMGVDVVLLDWLMPNMGGRECAEQLLRQRPAQKIVVMSGYTGGWNTGDDLQSRLSGFLPKPLTTSQLLLMLGQVVARPASANALDT
jgi:signal transduction histidine kinase/ActR/RegA family two-component response regulator